MRVLDPGHLYELTSYDGAPSQILRFVKRCKPSAKYPGNTNAYGGTLIQEVLRALIERMEYVDGQIHCANNLLVIGHFRNALRLLEERAAERHGRVLKDSLYIECEPTCGKCGHLQCTEHYEATQTETRPSSSSALAG